MKHQLSTLMAFSFALFVNAQNVGIGTTTPHSSAQLHVNTGSSTTKGLLVTGLYNAASTVPDVGEGSKLMFYPGKAAFRAGWVNGTRWNNSNVGSFSTALGNSTTASGYASTALGNSTTASGDASTALGNNTTAGGSSSTALGLATTASGKASTALGTSTIASAPYSTALGESTRASGEYSTAMGWSTTARAIYSTALGESTLASGWASTAMGAATIASGDYSVAMGSSTTASEIYSTALGRGTTASGWASTAMGSSTTASGGYSTALGRGTTASGEYSVAIGRNVSTNGMTGAFFFGDSDPNNKGVRPIGFANQIAMRFNGGYYFISSDAGFDLGVHLPASGNSWSAISDARRKENFLPVDGESILEKIAAMPQYTWNYKGQDVKTLRHYGPMAQDFYSAFGQDAVGTIGCDTLINQQDFLGVNLIAIQALEKRTTTLKQENKELQKENKALQQQNKKLEARLEKLEKLITAKQ